MRILFKVEMGKVWSWKSGSRAAGVSFVPFIILHLLLLLLLQLPTTHAEEDELWLNSVSSVLREVTGQLERFNALYIDKLERELSASSARISALEATVRGVAERAAAWDNIQNHMAVWTDQSRTMEHKLDLLNRCHEKQASWEERLNGVDALNHKLTALDKKINSMTRLEFKVEQVSERMEEVDSGVKWLRKRMATPENPVLTEFAGRGVLSSLLSIEQQLTNISQHMPQTLRDEVAPVFTAHRVYGSHGGYGSSSSSNRRVQMEQESAASPLAAPQNIHSNTHNANTDARECLLHPLEVRRLQDVSAKVDLVFDRLTDPDYEYDNFVSQLQQRAAPVSDAFGQQEEEEEDNVSPEHLFARFWRSMFSPFKNLKKRLRSFESQLTTVNRLCNESVLAGGEAAAAGRELGVLGDEMRRAAHDSRQASADHTATLHKLTQSVSQVTYSAEQVLVEIRGGFQTLSQAVQDGFAATRDILLQYCTGNPRQPPTLPPLPPTVSTFPSTSNGDEGEGVVRSAGVITRDCSDLMMQGNAHSGVYTLNPPTLHRSSHGHDYYIRYCDQYSGGWTVIQRRGMFGPPYLNFTQNWYSYKDGFGDLTREFWWGNDNIHRLTNEQAMMVRFDMWDFEGNHTYAEYLTFRVGPEQDNYRLRVFDYRGNASDSFSAHNNFLFSTYDRNNDKAPACCPCSLAYGGGWWFYSCFESNLNGEYQTRPRDNQYRGIIWEMWLGDYSLMATEIKIRPRSFSYSEEREDEPTIPSPPTTYSYPAVPELPLRQL